MPPPVWPETSPPVRLASDVEGSLTALIATEPVAARLAAGSDGAVEASATGVAMALDDMAGTALLLASLPAPDREGRGEMLPVDVAAGARMVRIVLP